jgi:hypothetical protein
MDFPIPTLDKLPVRISPCPILQTVLEIRYVTGEECEMDPKFRPLCG